MSKKAMYDLRNMLCDELDELARKGELGAGDLEIAHKPPSAAAHKARRHLPGNPLNPEVGAEPFEHVNHKVQILRKIHFHKLRRVRVVLGFHSCPLDKLELVELHARKRQVIYEAAFLKHHLDRLSGKPEYEMGPRVDAPFRRCPHSLLRDGKAVSAVDA